MKQPDLTRVGLGLFSSVLLFMVLSFSTTSSNAQTSNIVAAYDAFVDPNNPTTNYDGARLEVTYSNFPNFTATRRTLLQFNLSGESTKLSTTPVAVHVVENNLPAGASVKLGLYTLVDSWEETTVTFANQPAVGELLQTVDVAAGFTGRVKFDAATVSAYLEAQRTSDNKAAFLLQLDGGSGSLGFAGNLLFEDHEGTHDGVNGNEPMLLTPAAMPTATATATPTVPPTQISTPALPTMTPATTPTQSVRSIFLPFVER